MNLHRISSLLLAFLVLPAGLPAWAVTYECRMDGERHRSCCCAKAAMCASAAAMACGSTAETSTDCGCCEREVVYRPAIEVIAATGAQLDLPASAKMFAAVPAFLQPVFFSPSKMAFSPGEGPPGRSSSGPPVFLLHQSILC